MSEQELFTREWRQIDIPPVGGSHQYLVVTAGNRQITVADYLVKDQEASAGIIYKAVNELIPKAIWNRLSAKLHKYAEKYRR